MYFTFINIFYLLYPIKGIVECTNEKKGRKKAIKIKNASAVVKITQSAIKNIFKNPKKN